MVLTQSLWPMSAWAGPAKPRTAAVSPLAITAANPNFFIFVPSSVALPVPLSCRSDRSNREVRGLIPLAAIDRRLAESHRGDKLGHAIHRPSEGPRVLPSLGCVRAAR